MPLLREHYQFALLLLCVPLQYYAGVYLGSNEVSRSYAISKLLTQFRELKSSWLRVEPWRKWCHSLLLRMTERPVPYAYDDGDPDDAGGESPAFEVLKYREQQGHGGHFGMSADVRNPKSPHVAFRVGQVVKHKLWGYHGVIVGWDETARAPEAWLEQMHGDKHEWRRQPNYALLVDTRDRPAPQLTYVPQENLQPVRQVKVLHPNVDEFFEDFDGSQYLPRPWLKGLYPRD